MIERTPCVYILVNRFNGAFYVGVTSDLFARIVQHRKGHYESHTRRYGVLRLVYIEAGGTMESAIRREKQVKRYRREWKMNLIERDNPTWDDLAVSMFGLPPLPPYRAARQTPAQGRGD
jgi:putative endonuclease